MIELQRLIGMGAAGAAGIAVLAPVVTIANDGTHSLLAITPVVAGLLSLAAALAAFYAWHASAKAQVACCLAGLLFAALGLYGTLVEIGLKSDQIEMQLREAAKAANMPDPNPPMGTIMMGTRLEWGWYPILGGLLVCLIAAVLTLRLRNR